MNTLFDSIKQDYSAGVARCQNYCMNMCSIGENTCGQNCDAGCTVNCDGSCSYGCEAACSMTCEEFCRTAIMF